MPVSATCFSYDKSLGLYKDEDEQSLDLLLVLHMIKAWVCIRMRMNNAWIC
jgi:hypothetical protein